MTNRERWMMSTDSAWMLDSLGGEADDRRKLLFTSACRDEAKLLSRSHQNYDAYNLEVVVAYWLYAGDSHISKESRCNFIRCLWPSPFIERERVEYDGPDPIIYGNKGFTLAPLIDPRWRTPLVLDLARQVMGGERCDTCNGEGGGAQHSTGGNWIACLDCKMGNTLPNPELMPILSDALQDAGADDMEIINHLQCEHHVAGHCWVIDAILENQSK